MKLKKIMTAFLAISAALTAHAAIGDSVAARKEKLKAQKNAGEVIYNPLTALGDEAVSLTIINALKGGIRSGKTEVTYFAISQTEFSNAGKAIPIPKGTLYIYYASEGILESASYIQDTIYAEEYTLTGDTDWYKLTTLRDKLLEKNGAPSLGKWKPSYENSHTPQNWIIHDSERNMARTADIERKGQTLRITGEDKRRPLNEEIAAAKKAIDDKFQEAAASVL